MKGSCTSAVGLAVVLAVSLARGQEGNQRAVALMPPVGKATQCNRAAVSLGQPMPAQLADPACAAIMPDTSGQPRSFRKPLSFPQDLGPAQFRLSIDALTVN